MAPPKGRPGAGKEGKQRGKSVKRQSDVDELRCGNRFGRVEGARTSSLPA